MCKFRHDNSPRCKLVNIGLCAKRRCQFKHGAHLSTETEPTISIEAPPLNSRILKKKFCHFFNNSFCKKRDMCKFRHENSPRCKLVDIGLCAKWRCQFKHGAHLSTEKEESDGHRYRVDCEYVNGNCTNIGCSRIRMYVL